MFCRILLLKFDFLIYCTTSQAHQVCYIPYPYIKKPKQPWFNVLKVNPRKIISEEYEDEKPTLLQQENDDDVLMTTIEDLAVEHFKHA